MKTVWIQDLKDSEERKKFIESLKNSKIVLDKLKKIVYNIREDRQSVRHDDYDCSSWSHQAAHTNGFLEACDKFIELLETNHRNNNE